MTLADRIHELANKHGSLRALAKVCDVDPGYLSRLYHGSKTEPGAALLRRLGLRKVVTYELAARRSRPLDFASLSKEVFGPELIGSATAAAIYSEQEERDERAKVDPLSTKYKGKP